MEAETEAQLMSPGKNLRNTGWKSSLWVHFTALYDMSLQITTSSPFEKCNRHIIKGNYQTKLHVLPLRLTLSPQNTFFFNTRDTIYVTPTRLKLKLSQVLVCKKVALRWENRGFKNIIWLFRKHTEKEQRGTCDGLGLALRTAGSLGATVALLLLFGRGI